MGYTHYIRFFLMGLIKKGPNRKGFPTIFPMRVVSSPLEVLMKFDLGSEAPWVFRFFVAA